VKQVIIFGSYLSDSLTLGDIDLAITLECKYDDPETRGRKIRERIQRVQQEGKRFRTMVEMYGWPQLEIFKMLKAGSPSISLHDAEAEHILSEPIALKILFDARLESNQYTGKTS
jgi:hypothetical protein